MLASVLVPDPDPTRRIQLADEAMAIAAVGGESELRGVGAAGPAPGLVAARPPRRAHRGRPRRRAPRPRRRQHPPRADGDAVRHERPAGAGSHGRAPGDARRVHGARRRAARRAVPGVRDVPAGVARAVGRRLRRGPAPRRRRPRRRAQVARRQRRGGLRRRLVPAGPRPRHAAGDAWPRASACTRPTRGCGCGRSPSCAASSPPAASTTPGSTTRISSVVDGVQLRDNQMYLPGHVHAGRGGGGDRRSRRGPPSCAGRWSRTPIASPPAGWPGSRSDRSATTSGWPPRRPATSPPPPPSSARPSSATSADGTRPHEARAHHALGARAAAGRRGEDDARRSPRRGRGGVRSPPRSASCAAADA